MLREARSRSKSASEDKAPQKKDDSKEGRRLKGASIIIFITTFIFVSNLCLISRF